MCQILWKSHFVILSTFRTLLKGFVFVGNAVIFWTYAITSRINLGPCFRKSLGPVGPRAHGPMVPRAYSGRVVGFKVPRLSAKTTILELSRHCHRIPRKRWQQLRLGPPYTRARGKDDGSYKFPHNMRWIVDGIVCFVSRFFSLRFWRYFWNFS